VHVEGGGDREVDRVLQLLERAHALGMQAGRPAPDSGDQGRAVIDSQPAKGAVGQSHHSADAERDHVEVKDQVGLAEAQEQVGHHAHRGQDGHRARRPDRRAVLAQPPDLGGVVAEDEGDRGDGAGLNHGHARPGEQKRHAAAHAFGEEHVFAAGVRMARGELGVDQRTAKRHGAAEDPGKKELRPARRVGRHDGRRLEDARADHHAADQHDAVEDRELL